MTRTAEEITQAHQACLDGADTVTVVIATHGKGYDATDADFAHDLTHDEKKARVSRSVSYLKHQKDTYSDWGSNSFTVINAAIIAADNFTG